MCIAALGLTLAGLEFFSTIWYGDYFVVKKSLGQAVQNCTHAHLFLLPLYTGTVALSLNTCTVEGGASLASQVNKKFIRKLKM
jgi:hypothetical protein